MEIVLGEHRYGDGTLRLVVDHPDTCRRLTAALDDANDKLTRHLYAKAYRDPALSDLNPGR